jgi:hypothetical protein
MLFTVKMEKKREKVVAISYSFVFAHNTRAVEARWETAAEAR